MSTNLKEDKMNISEDKAFYEKAGSSRALSSSTFILLSSLVGSILLWVFLVIGTGSGGLEYYSLASTIAGLFNAINSGFASSYIARIKAKTIQNQTNISFFISTYSKILIIIASILSVICIISALIFQFFINDEYFTIVLWMILPTIIPNYVSGLMGNLLNVNNRYDITGFISGFFGISVFISGLIFIVIGIPGVIYGFIPMIVTSVGISLNIIFFTKKTPYKFKTMFKEGDIKHPEAYEFIKYSTLTTITSLDTLGILGNTVIFITAFTLGFLVPNEIRLQQMEIITIIMGYVMARVIIFFFSGPLNVEIAEAISRNDLDLVEEVINNMGKIAFVLGLTLLVAISAFSGTILKVLHINAFLNQEGLFQTDLFEQAIFLFIFGGIGQFLYAFASFFGSALIGSGNAKYSAIGFGTTLILCIILTPIFVILFGFLGAGITMLITSLFLLPYMIIVMKKKLKINTDFRLLRQIPHLTCIGFLMFFYPIGDIFGLLIDLAVVILLSIFLLIIFLPFFGVSSPEDSEFLIDIFKTMKMEKIGITISKFIIGLYYLNPTNKKE